jgi:hypothetical protein
LLEVDHIGEATQLLFKFFEEVGYLTQSGVVSIERVMNTYGREIRLSWALVEPALKIQREEYTSPYRYAKYEDLYQRALDYDRTSGGTGSRPTKAELKLFVMGSATSRF